MSTTTEATQGERALRALLEHLGEEGAAAARRLGVPRQHLHAWQAGRRGVSLDKVAELAAGLGVVLEVWPHKVKVRRAGEERLPTADELEAIQAHMRAWIEEVAELQGHVNDARAALSAFAVAVRRAAEVSP